MQHKSHSKKSFSFTVRNFFGRLISGKSQPVESSVQNLYTPRKTALSHEKKRELELLCEQLFKQKDYITSGKIQFIGLAKIQKKMGKRWEGLCRIVYEIADEVIASHLDQGDISILYKDNTYVLVFARASLEEGRTKATLIAHDIQERLFAQDEEDLKDIEIRKAVSEIKASYMTDNFSSDFLDALLEWEDDPEEMPDEDEEIPVIDPLEVEAVAKRTVAKRDEPAELTGTLFYSFIPLWDVPRNALTTYLCLTCNTDVKTNTLSAHENFYQKLPPEQKISLDVKTLQRVMIELQAMEKDNRQLLIACPVHYDTLYRFEDYEVYKKTLDQIPEQHKQYLIFVVMNQFQTIPSKNPYWFAAPLRSFCRHVFAEIPLRPDVNFNYLRNTGVDVVGVRLEEKVGSEQKVLNILSGLSVKAKALKIPKTFVLGISSLSLTTSAVCSGFDFLGGPAIHDAVDNPDTIHRYRHQDLVSNLTKNK